MTDPNDPATARSGGRAKSDEKASQRDGQNQATSADRAPNKGVSTDDPAEGADDAPGGDGGSPRG